MTTEYNTGLYRIVVEISHMSNNDEYVFYDCKEWTWEDVDKHKEVQRLGSYLDKPSLALCRLVTLEEIKQGLDVYYQGDAREESTAPRATYLLDGLAKLLSYVDTRVNILGSGAQEAVVSYIANFVYDCMSSGCDRYSIAACRQLIRKYNIPLDTEVYPRIPTEDDPREWSTVQDFLEDIKDIPELDNLLLKCDLPLQLVENFGE